MTDDTQTLEDIMRDLLGTEETPPEEPQDDTTPAEEETPEEKPEAPQEAPEGEDEAEEKPEATDEETDAKMAELEAKYGQPDDSDPWLPIKSEQQALIQEEAALQTSFLTGLPGIKDDAGKSIYEMDEPQFDLFLQQLDDDGKERVKINAVQAREAAVQKAMDYQQRQQSFNQRLQEYNQANLEMEVITDIAQQLGLPEVVAKYKDGSITKNVSKRAQSDPSVARKATTKEGLYELALSAIRDLQIVKSKDTDSKKPSAPDAKTASKKVKTLSPSDNSDAALMAKVATMSTSEYQKLDEKTKDRLLYASIKDAL